MSKAMVELDFLGMEKNSPSSSSSKSQLRKLFDRQRSFRGVHEAIRKMNPELLRSPNLSPKSPPPESHCPETAPLTIFYNGMVSVFDVPQDKAENIFKFAAEGFSKSVEPADQKIAMSAENLVENLSGEKLSRRVSLQRFLEKRKERLISVPSHPYQRSSAHLLPQIQRTK